MIKVFWIFNLWLWFMQLLVFWMCLQHCMKFLGHTGFLCKELHRYVGLESASEPGDVVTLRHKTVNCRLFRFRPADVVVVDTENVVQRLFLQDKNSWQLQIYVCYACCFWTWGSRASIFGQYLFEVITCTGNQTSIQEPGELTSSNLPSFQLSSSNWGFHWDPFIHRDTFMLPDVGSIFWFVMGKLPSVM